MCAPLVPRENSQPIMSQVTDVFGKLYAWKEIPMSLLAMVARARGQLGAPMKWYGDKEFFGKQHLFVFSVLCTLFSRYRTCGSSRYVVTSKLPTLWHNLYPHANVKNSTIPFKYDNITMKKSSPSCRLESRLIIIIHPAKKGGHSGSDSSKIGIQRLSGIGTVIEFDLFCKQKLIGLTPGQAS